VYALFKLNLLGGVRLISNIGLLLSNPFQSAITKKYIRLTVFSASSLSVGKQGKLVMFGRYSGQLKQRCDGNKLVGGIDVAGVAIGGITNLAGEQLMKR